jgi:glyoxylase-like metal-dependent hydrolase (beta-lactamase superfamily II)
VRPAPDFDRIASNIAIWHAYDSAVKTELYSSCLACSDGTYLIDPIPLEREALDELIGSGAVAGTIVTNSNHMRACWQFAERFSVPIFVHGETLPENPRQLMRVADCDQICGGLRVIGVEGAAPGEIVLYYAANGGTLIVGDALINFEPYGFTFLPAKYCSSQKEMRRSLRRLLDYKAERILFAHGMPILSGAGERLQGLLNSSL